MTHLEVNGYSLSHKTNLLQVILLEQPTYYGILWRLSTFTQLRAEFLYLAQWECECDVIRKVHALCMFVQA